MTYAFHPDARLEYLAAIEFYEQRRMVLGATFSIEVETAIGRILESPARRPVIERGVRRCLTHAFPYGILYTIDQDVVLILAVMHCARKPGYWKSHMP